MLTRQLYGGVAQLGARLNGIQKVRGSIPLVSTITNLRASGGYDKPGAFFIPYNPHSSGYVVQSY